MMGTLEELCRFFGFSPKRQQLLEHKILEERPQSTHRKLKDLCKTRWVQHLDALKVFEELLMTVVYTLEDIKAQASGSWNSESISKANRLLHQITDFGFIMTFTVTKECLISCTPGG